MQLPTLPCSQRPNVQTYKKLQDVHAVTCQKKLSTPLETYRSPKGLRMVPEEYVLPSHSRHRHHHRRLHLYLYRHRRRYQ